MDNAGVESSVEHRFFWILARQVERIRGVTKDGPFNLRPEHVFTTSVRAELKRVIDSEPSGVHEAAALSMHTPAKQWHEATEHLAGKVIGLGICKPMSTVALLSFLPKNQREVQDHWIQAQFFEAPIFL